jgi:hypothetical protein
MRLTIPHTSALFVQCVVGAFLGGSPGGAGIGPPGYTQCLATGSAPNFFFGRFFLFLADL